MSIFRTENDAEKLWLPRGSQYLSNKEWKGHNFVEGTRWHTAMVTHHNDVMTPEGMLKVN